LLRSYDIGREAIKNGLRMLDVVELNTEALTTLLKRASSPEEASRIARSAGRFLLEALAPFEMTMVELRNDGR
jgi:hypothetical protein